MYLRYTLYHNFEFMSSNQIKKHSSIIIPVYKFSFIWYNNFKYKKTGGTRIGK